MTINEQQRVRLHQSLERQIGEDMAGLLMSSLPPFDWNQIATKDDLKVFATREEINVKFAEMDVKFTELRAESNVKFAELRAEIAEHEKETIRMISRTREDINHALRNNLLAIMGLMVTFMGIFLAKI